MEDLTDIESYSCSLINLVAEWKSEKAYPFLKNYVRLVQEVEAKQEVLPVLSLHQRRVDRGGEQPCGD